MNPPAIAVQALSKRFGRRLAVEDLTFEVPQGSVCAFLGRNGAGKSTAIRMMMNLLDPISGRVTLLGLDSRRDHTALMRRVGYVSESPVMYEWMKVRDLVRFTAEFYPRWNHRRVDELFEIASPSTASRKSATFRAARRHNWLSRWLWEAIRNC
jgi:ABC-2 type transport system ATP-binding protein